MKIPTPQNIEAAAHQAGLNMSVVCVRANVARSTFTRAKSGETTLTSATMTRLLAAIPESKHEPAG